MLTPQELEAIWRPNSQVPSKATQNVYNMFSHHIYQTPDAEAICAWDGILSYASLDKLATDLAGQLVERGVGPGVLVPLCFEKSMWTSVAILSVVKASAGFVLIDPSLPEKRARRIIEQVGDGLMLCSAATKDLSSRLAKQVLAIDDAPCIVKHQPTKLPPVDPSAVIYVVFTSGSTGTPKGVLVTYANAASALLYQVEPLGMTSDSRLYDFASYTFDGSINNLFTVLAAGGCICVPSDDDRKNSLVQSIQSLRANTLDLTPSVARLLSPEQLPNIKAIIFAGEALSVAEAKRWFGKVDIRNGYGPSECTPTATVNSSPSNAEECTHIGTGAGLVTWLVNPDDHNQLVVRGHVGELLLEGPLVGPGYLNDPSKTAAAFISAPEWLLKGTPSHAGRCGRLYKTGDLMRQTEGGGGLEYVGRKDTQIKLRGQRIELGEVEAAMAGLPYVGCAVAMLQETSTLEPWIAGFVTITDDCEDILHDKQTEEHELQYTETWGSHYDDSAYEDIDTISSEAIGRDFIGWTSMYDGSQLDQAEMIEWLNDTVVTILDGRPVGTVLEVGSGSGMMLFNLKHGLDRYIGLEPSRKAVNFLNKAISKDPLLKTKARAYEGTAADILSLASYTAVTPNLVLFNSVIQHFPSQIYLIRAIENILQLKEVDTIFFGDVRSYATYAQFQITKALHMTSNASKLEIRRLMEGYSAVEYELLVDPGFFTALRERFPERIAHVEILPKKVRAINELSCYRYAAVLHIKPHGQEAPSPQELDADSWVDFETAKLDRESLGQLLRRHDSSKVAISNIPCQKTITEKCILQLLAKKGDNADWLAAAHRKASAARCLSALELDELAKETGYRLELSWARQYSHTGGLDAVFFKGELETSDATRVLFQFPTDHQSRSSHSLTSRPMRHQFNRRVETAVSDALRDTLPSYMVPQQIFVLEMPLNQNGKIDRQALKASLPDRPSLPGLKRQPTSESEQRMQAVWAKAFGIKAKEIGLDDGFSSLGGNSATAMGLVHEACKAGFRLKVTDIFRNPAINLRELVELGLIASKRTENATVDLMAEISRHDAVIAAAQPQPCEANAGQVPCVLLTGANGYIGTQILRRVLEGCHFGRVIVLARGPSTEAARQRIVEAAKEALWWTQLHGQTLEVWRGDLSLPRLGLDAANWACLNDGMVDTVIHNGAVVHFSHSYETLSPANVSSTAELARVAVAVPHMRLVYVSTLRDEIEDEAEAATRLGQSNLAYGQTKFVAETLVKRAAIRDESMTGTHRMVVVSPGLVLGTPTEGVPNADDWIWRLVSACIRVGLYNADNADQWVEISDATTTASTIVSMATMPSPPFQVQMRTGMTWGTLWATLALLGHNIEPVPGDEWYAAVRKDMATSQQDHPFWTMAETFEDIHRVVAPAAKGRSAEEELCSPLSCRLALWKGAQILAKIGVLPPPTLMNSDSGGENATDAEATAAAFRRSGLTIPNSNGIKQQDEKDGS